MDRLGIVRTLDSQRSPVVTTRQFALITGVSPRTARLRLHRLVRDGVLVRVMKGHYCLPDTDPRAVATGVFAPSYVTLLKAFEFHGTTTQSSRGIDVVNAVRSRALKLELDEGSLDVRFIRVAPDLVFGCEKVSLGGKDAFMADRERAVIDGLMFPGRVPLDEVVECLRDGIDVAKAADYARRTGRQVVMKRLGHLVEASGHAIPPDAIGPLTPTWVPLDPALPRRGRHDARWRVIVNRVVE
jgi:predicted transcriptional regulator of viral defense system